MDSHYFDSSSKQEERINKVVVKTRSRREDPFGQQPVEEGTLQVIRKHNQEANTWNVWVRRPKQGQQGFEYLQVLPTQASAVKLNEDSEEEDNTSSFFTTPTPATALYNFACEKDGIYLRKTRGLVRGETSASNHCDTAQDFLQSLQVRRVLRSPSVSPLPMHRSLQQAETKINKVVVKVIAGQSEPLQDPFKEEKLEAGTLQVVKNNTTGQVYARRLDPQTNQYQLFEIPFSRDRQSLFQQLVSVEQKVTYLREASMFTTLESEEEANKECCDAAEIYLQSMQSQEDGRRLKHFAGPALEEFKRQKAPQAPYIPYYEIEREIKTVVVKESQTANANLFDGAMPTPKQKNTAYVVKVLGAGESHTKIYVLNGKDHKNFDGVRSDLELAEPLFYSEFKEGTYEWSNEQEDSLDKIFCSALTAFIKQNDPNFFNPLLNLDLTPEQRKNIEDVYGKNMLAYVASMGKLIDTEYRRVDQELQAGQPRSRGKMDESSESKEQEPLSQERQKVGLCVDKFRAFVETLQKTPARAELLKEIKGGGIEIKKNKFIEASFTAAQELQLATAKCENIKNETWWLMSRILNTIIFAGAGVGITLSAGAIVPVIVGAALIGAGLGFFAGSKLAHVISPTLDDYAKNVVSDTKEETVSKRLGASSGSTEL
jgi:hypothetical protein